MEQRLDERNGGTGNTIVGPAFRKKSGSQKWAGRWSSLQVVSCWNGGHSYCGEKRRGSSSMTKVHHRASRPLPFFSFFFFLFFLPFFDFSPLRIPPRIERIANEWKIHVDAPDSSFLRTSKHVSSSSPCLASPRPFAPPRPSTPTSMPFCIPGAYHLRVRHPRNRSVSRNNTRCHGHPSIRQRIPMLPFSSPLRFTRSETIEDRNMGEAETTHS